MQDGKICTLAAIIMIGLIEISLILTHQDGATLVAVVAVVAGLGGLVIPSPFKKDPKPSGDSGG